MNWITKLAEKYLIKSYTGTEFGIYNRIFISGESLAQSKLWISKAHISSLLLPQENKAKREESIMEKTLVPDYNDDDEQQNQQQLKQMDEMNFICQSSSESINDNNVIANNDYNNMENNNTNNNPFESIEQQQADLSSSINPFENSLAITIIDASSIYPVNNDGSNIMDMDDHSFTTNSNQVPLSTFTDPTLINSSINDSAGTSYPIL
ncbi:hypothetical protein DERF_008192 [Dermatophagoides farinae]|uniref:Uncharacterized protein n=1 Tax=Dermatophagoides farinae TaxID=6954 RepID=A0A922I127_DERFA|nr:hypothetical protein DERF_008192 [Dermatophagoides farinae]